jgi:hypothetical protein
MNGHVKTLELLYGPALYEYFSQKALSKNALDRENHILVYAVSDPTLLKSLLTDSMWLQQAHHLAYELYYQALAGMYGSPKTRDNVVKILHEAGIHASACNTYDDCPVRILVQNIVREKNPAAREYGLLVYLLEHLTVDARRETVRKPTSDTTDDAHRTAYDLFKEHMESLMASGASIRPDAQKALQLMENS